MCVSGIEVKLPDSTDPFAVQGGSREVFKVCPVRGHADTVLRKRIKVETSECLTPRVREKEESAPLPRAPLDAYPGPQGWHPWPQGERGHAGHRSAVRGQAGAPSAGKRVKLTFTPHSLDIRGQAKFSISRLHTGKGRARVPVFTLALFPRLRREVAHSPGDVKRSSECAMPQSIDAIRSYRFFFRDTGNVVTRTDEVELGSDDDARQLATLTLKERTACCSVEVWDRGRLVCIVHRGE